MTRVGAPPPLPEPLPAEVVDSHCHLDAMGVDIGQSLVDAAGSGCRGWNAATTWSTWLRDSYTWRSSQNLRNRASDA